MQKKITIVIVITIFWYCAIRFLNWNTQNNNIEILKNISFSGTVLSKKENHDDHGSLSLTLSGDSIVDVTMLSPAYLYIQADDFVEKKKGDTKLVVKRGNIFKSFYLIYNGDTIKK